MAKSAKGKKDEGKKRAFGEREEYKYDVNTLSKDLGIEPASVRVALRKAEVAKAGKSYGWDDRDDYEEVLAELKKASKGSSKDDKKGKSGKGKKAAEDEPEEDEPEDRPAKGSKKVRRR